MWEVFLPDDGKCDRNTEARWNTEKWLLKAKHKKEENFVRNNEKSDEALCNIPFIYQVAKNTSFNFEKGSLSFNAVQNNNSLRCNSYIVSFAAELFYSLLRVYIQ